VPQLSALPSAGGQRVECNEGVAVVRVATGPGRPESGLDPAPYLRATPYLNHEDPALARLLPLALTGAGEEPSERAEALRAFVHRYLTRKDLGTGFATASEVAKLRSGDCTEHAVLLAALLRGAGIASRVVAGLLYVEEFAGERQIFGYHMWTQALLGGRWADLDAMTAEPFDAAHIALATSALTEGEGLVETGALLASLMGTLSIEVVEAEGRPPAIP
jgi:transglutaminase-like putative cysteine protease